MTRVIRQGNFNPMLIIEKEQVLEWLRTIADENGFSDRSISSVQINVNYPFRGGALFHHEVPELVLMVSNIPSSVPKEHQK